MATTRQIHPFKSLSRRETDKQVHALIRKINRRLARKRQQLVTHAVKGRYYSEIARFFYLLDDRRGLLVRTVDDLKAFAEQMGVH